MLSMVGQCGDGLGQVKAHLHGDRNRRQCVARHVPPRQRQRASTLAVDLKMPGQRKPAAGTLLDVEAVLCE